MSLTAKLDETRRQLVGDLETLAKLIITQSALTEGDIRAASVILRKWLVDNALQRYCRAASVTASLPALDTSLILEQLASQVSIDYYLTGGVRFRGRPIIAVYHSTAESTGAPLLDGRLLQWQDYTVAQFLRQKRLYFRGSYFTTEDIIRFIANKLGGAHIEFERDDKFLLFMQASDFMQFGGPSPPDDTIGSDCVVYAVLEPDSPHILKGTHVEVVAAGASFVQLKLDGSPVLPIEPGFATDPDKFRFLLKDLK